MTNAPADRRNIFVIPTKAIVGLKLPFVVREGKWGKESP